MMSHAGIAQRLEHQPMASQQAAPAGDAGKTPAPRSIAQAIAAGLNVDKRARAVGHHDGARGLPFQPPHDWNFLLAYALGYRAGQMFGPRK